MKTAKLNQSIFILFSLLIFASCSSDPEKGSSTSKPLKYSANNLMKKFEKNSAKYDTLLKQKAIKLEGKIKEIELGSLGKTMFVLSTKSKAGACIKCEMMSDDMQYEPGDKVCLIGFYKDYDFSLTLDKCITCNSVPAKK